MLTKRNDNIIWTALAVFVAVMVSVILLSVLVEVVQDADTNGLSVSTVKTVEAVGPDIQCANSQIVPLTFYTPDKVKGICFGTGTKSYYLSILCSNAYGNTINFVSQLGVNGVWVTTGCIASYPTLYQSRMYVDV